MWMRALCAALVLAIGPATAGAASLCCSPASACCEDDRPACPSTDGEVCALAAASQTPATIASPGAAAPLLLAAPSWLPAPPAPLALRTVAPGRSPFPPHPTIPLPLRS